MSSSSLWVLDNKLVGNEEIEFNNSWLYTPVALDVLFHKYIPSRRINRIGSKSNYITETMFDKDLFSNLNKLINDSEIQEDRVMWEMCNQQLFFSKDKELVSNCITNFLDNNKEFMNDCENHIFDRFKEVAKCIKEIEEEIYPYFVFKNTSVDDGVEYWFQKYNEETDEYENSSLLDLDEYVTEFVVIENQKITKFIGNLKFKI